MKLTIRSLSAVALGAMTLAAFPVRADTGSDWLDAQVARLGQELALRSEFADAARSFHLAHGYGMPDALARRVNSALAQAAVRIDDGAFAHEISQLRQTMKLYTLAERR